MTPRPIKRHRPKLTPLTRALIEIHKAQPNIKAYVLDTSSPGVDKR